jgi:hypothetical protein
MKKSPILTAVDLLKKNGYTVTKKRADPRIGDVVRFRDELTDGVPDEVLITFHQTEPDPGNTEDVWDFGGVIVSKKKWVEQYTEAMWIDRNEWAKDDGQYEVIGHVNLDKYMKE